MALSLISLSLVLSLIWVFVLSSLVLCLIWVFGIEFDMGFLCSV